MTGHVTLPCEVYIFIFDKDCAWSIDVVVAKRKCLLLLLE